MPPALVVLDASVVIAFREQADAHHRAAVAAFKEHQSDKMILPVVLTARAWAAVNRRVRVL